jgi:hypothetical protein
MSTSDGAVGPDPGSSGKRYDPRTRQPLDGPITPTLLRLAAPSVLVMRNCL